MQLHFARHQEGATLIVSLILLLVLTIVGISTIESVNLQSLMARNSQFQVESYQVALSEIEGPCRAEARHFGFAQWRASTSLRANGI